MPQYRLVPRRPARFAIAFTALASLPLSAGVTSSGQWTRFPAAHASAEPAALARPGTDARANARHRTDAIVTLHELPQGEFSPVHPSNIAADGTVVGISFASIGEVSDQIVRWPAGGEPESLGGGPSFALINITPVMSADGSVIVNPHFLELDDDPFVVSVPMSWRDGDGWQPLAGLSLETSLPFGISADGSHVVGAGGDSGAAFHPWIWSSAQGQVLLPIPADRDSGEAWAVSDDGRIATGFVTLRDTDEWGWPITYQFGSRWVDGVWQALTDSDGHPLGQAVACTADCSIVVGGGAGGDSSHLLADRAWYWNEVTGAVYLDPSTLPPTAQPPFYAIDVSDDGSTIVGTYFTFHEDPFGTVRRTQPFVWHADTGMRSLTELMAAHDIDFGGEGWELVANSISGDGTRILLNGMDDDFQVRSAVLSIRSDVIFADGFELE